MLNPLQYLFSNYKKLLMLVYSQLEQENPLYYVSMGEALPPPLDKEEEEKTFAMLATDPDTARRRLIEHNLRLVVYIARKFDNTGVHIEDLISIGTIGLIKAVNTFNVKKNIKLATYASRCIENEILMHLRRSCRQKLEVSLDEPMNIDSDGNELLLSDVLGTNTMLSAANSRTRLTRSFYKGYGEIRAARKEIVTLRYGLYGTEERTQKQVADMMGISQSYISRLEKRILGF